MNKQKYNNKMIKGRKIGAPGTSDNVLAHVWPNTNHASLLPVVFGEGF